MIKNKLGIRSYSEMIEIEKEIVSTKIALLDDRITFNMEDLNLEFLVRIHKFLFGDIYDEEYTNTRMVKEDELKDIDYVFKKLMRLGVNSEKIDLKALEFLLVKL